MQNLSCEKDFYLHENKKSFWYPLSAKFNPATIRLDYQPLFGKMSPHSSASGKIKDQTRETAEIEPRRRWTSRNSPRLWPRRWARGRPVSLAIRRCWVWGPLWWLTPFLSSRLFYPTQLPGYYFKKKIETFSIHFYTFCITTQIICFIPLSATTI